MNKTLVSFPLSFSEAMEHVFNGGAVQGENFKWNCYLTAINEVVQINTFDEHAALKYSHCNCLLTQGLMKQHFRTVSVFNRAGLFFDGVVPQEGV